MTEDIKSRDGDVVSTRRRRRIVNQGVFDRPYMDRRNAKGKAKWAFLDHVWQRLGRL